MVGGFIVRGLGSRSRRAEEAAAMAATSSPWYDAVPQLGRLRKDVLFGDVWKQPELSPRDRSLVTCAVLAATGRDEELTFHLRRAVENGVTADELRGLVVQVAFYAGWPSAFSAVPVVKGVFDGRRN
jgi:4-carboxymuconolactone decarboxylase